MSLTEFYDQLEAHDWYFPFSDDGRVYKRGSDNYDRLVKLSKTSPEHEKLFKAYQEHMNTGQPWGTVQTPKPERPPAIQYGTVDLLDDEFDPKYTKVTISVTLDGDILEAVKARAKDQRVEVSAMINDTLRRVWLPGKRSGEEEL